MLRRRLWVIFCTGKTPYASTTGRSAAVYASAVVIFTRADLAASHASTAARMVREDGAVNVPLASAAAVDECQAFAASREAKRFLCCSLLPLDRVVFMRASYRTPRAVSWRVMKLGKRAMPSPSAEIQAGPRSAGTTRGVIQLSTVAICGNSAAGGSANLNPKPALSCGGGGI